MNNIYYNSKFINLTCNRYSRSWNTQGSITVCGHAYLDEKYYEGHSLAIALNERCKSEPWSELFRRLNGSFAVIIEYADKLIAATDTARSYPIFYRIIGNTLAITDHPRKLLNIGEPASVNEDRINEFLASGYVLGDATLASGIQQLQAGEYLEAQIDHASGKINLEISPYRQFLLDPAPVRNITKMQDGLRELDVIFDDLSLRLVKALRGRQAVVPLSGGYDSRCMLALLLKQRYDNIMCFTYGSAISSEVEIARSVAEQLNVPWVHLVYSESTWRNLLTSGILDEHNRWTDNLSVLPHVAGLPAGLMLRDQKLIDDDAIFLPGHTPLGSAHAANLLTHNTLTDVIDTIRYRFFGWVHSYDLTKDSWSKIVDHVQSEINGIYEPNSPYTMARLLEWWVWKNGETKYICNSVRSIEFAGYSWMMPLYDNSLLEFWESIPEKWRLRKELFENYIANWSIVNKIPCRYDPPVNPLRHRILKLLKTLKADRFLMKYRNRPGGRKDAFLLSCLIPKKDLERLSGYTVPTQTYLIERELALVTQDIVSSNINSSD